ncbi:MAG: hypothetical protein HY000_36420 [Planctomycetes bacterium]|nr:hypothetical protein [Planctomycetota bacterium]
MISRRVGICALYVLLSPVILAVVLIAMIVVAILAAFTWAALRWRCWRTETWRYVVCSPQRGWHAFLTNNLLAAIPPGVATVWAESAAGMALRSVVARGAGLPKPYLATVTLLRIRVRPLHGQLLPFKGFGRKDAEVQQHVRKVLEAECHHPR